MFGEWLHFGSNKKFLLNKALIVQIFKKKWHFSKRVAKVGFYLAQKKALANKYLLIIGEARSMFGKFEMLKPATELNFWLWWRVWFYETCNAQTVTYPFLHNNQIWQP